MRTGEEERTGRGFALQELVRAVERRIRKLPRSAPRWPQAGPLEVRKAIVRKTPYLLIYAIVPDGIVVVALAHTRRRPGYWRDRLVEG